MPFGLTNANVLRDSLNRFVYVCLDDIRIFSPVLIQPDLNKPFIVEVDASDIGVAVLSQHTGPGAKLQPRLSPAERSYDVGDRELLAIKLTLEVISKHCKTYEPSLRFSPFSYRPVAIVTVPIQ